MSQDLLTSLAPPPELTKLLGARQSPSERPHDKPGEDFLAVLDRALSEKPLEKPFERTSEARPEEFRRDERAESRLVSETGANVAAESPANQPPVPAQPQAKIVAPVKIETEVEALASARLEKTHSRHDSTVVVHTVPRHDDKHNADKSKGNIATVVSTVAAQNLVQSSLASISQGMAKMGADPTAAISKKIDFKTGEPARDVRIESGRKKLATKVAENSSPELAAKKPVIKTVASGNGEKAAEKMQLHADTGGTKGLQDALSVVKNLADKLGLPTAASAESAQAATRTLELGRTPLNLTVLKPNQPNQHGAAAEKTDKTEKVANAKNSRIELLRAERLGRHEGGDLLQQAADKGRVQVIDHSRQAFKPSLVLESMLADKNQSGQAGRADEASRKDSLQLVNTAFLSPVNDRNTVSIPVHLTASQHGNLAQALRSHLSEKGNTEIVQQARIIMNGQESGEIKLILKPENLGEVRIHLQMQDGHIAGQIFVENKEVQAAFEENLNSLIQAFQDGGLSTGNMQVVVDQRGSGQPGQSDRQFAEDRSDERRKIHAVRSLENSVATVAAADSPYSQVNLVV